MRNILYAMLGFAALGACPSQAIVGPSTPGSPLRGSLVMVLTSQGGTAGFCTGVVVAPTVVLTAAHCVPPGAALRVDLPEAGSDPVLLPVADVARHPGYRADAIRARERSVDLALVRLPTPLPGNFVPATIASTTGASPGQAFAVSGFGVVREGEARSSGQLRSATLALREPLSAVLLWAHDASGRGAGACTGDSGGPVALPDQTAVVALTLWSAGTGRRRCGDLTQALWIAPYRGWIEGTMAAWHSVR